MTTIYVTYAGNSDTWFDRDYYVAHHLPLVMKYWGPHGLESCAAFFPVGNDGGTIQICECKFRDDAAFHAALAAPETKDVMADVSKFTHVMPVQLRGLPLEGNVL